MQVIKIEIFKDTFLYIDKKIYNVLKKETKHPVNLNLPITFFSTSNIDVIKRMKEGVD
jgi:hypothetical protein